jgi:ATP-dependent RNA helicase DDX35
MEHATEIAYSSLPRNATKLIPLALHAGLSTDEQMKIFETVPADSRKVIVSTNIAEVVWKFCVSI